MALVTLKNLSFTYPNGNHRALSDISLTIESGAFVTLMGSTGSGKSTLLRLLKPELRQNGNITGTDLFDGEEITKLSPRDSARRIGYVAQNPDEQLVTDKVWHELAFTLENLGYKRADIARRVGETAAYFDLEPLMERDTSTLSGGEKQLLNLAAVMATDPELLLLDEPTAQLDPIAAARFIDTIHRLNRETGVTVLICEHRTEELSRSPTALSFSITDSSHLTIYPAGSPKASAVTARIPPSCPRRRVSSIRSAAGARSL